MIYLQYLGLTIVSFLSLIIGMIIHNYAKEEVIQGKHILQIMQKVIIVLIAILIIYFHQNVITIALTLLFTGIAYTHIKYAYIIFGTCMAALFNSPAITLYVVLIFLFGLPTGSLAKLKNKIYKNRIKQIAIQFFPIALLLPLLLTYF